MRSIAFSSDDLPDEFDDRARLSAWQDFLAEVLRPARGLGSAPPAKIAEITSLMTMVGGKIVHETDGWPR